MSESESRLVVSSPGLYVLIEKKKSETDWYAAWCVNDKFKLIIYRASFTRIVTSCGVVVLFFDWTGVVTTVEPYTLIPRDSSSSSSSNASENWKLNKISPTGHRNIDDRKDQPTQNCLLVWNKIGIHLPWIENRLFLLFRLLSSTALWWFSRAIVLCLEVSVN